MALQFLAHLAFAAMHGRRRTPKRFCNSATAQALHAHRQMLPLRDAMANTAKQQTDAADAIALQMGMRMTPHLASKYDPDAFALQLAMRMAPHLASKYDPVLHCLDAYAARGRASFTRARNAVKQLNDAIDTLEHMARCLQMYAALSARVQLHAAHIGPPSALDGICLAARCVTFATTEVLDVSALSRIDSDVISQHRSSVTRWDAGSCLFNLWSCVLYLRVYNIFGGGIYGLCTTDVRVATSCVDVAFEVDGKDGDFTIRVKYGRKRIVTLLIQVCGVDLGVWRINTGPSCEDPSRIT